MKLKVCGMRENENILALSDLRPDYIGFIFWASSSRYVNSPTPKLGKKIKKTGVFVDASVEYVQGDFCTEANFLEVVKNIEVIFHLISTSLPADSNLDPVNDAVKNIIP
ncbi:MAG: hypothetical protein P8N55_05725, partial [Flavobacteriaceae bacterium]|nr:hypothetical protein [Flavobacteriaceae bacterium]